MIVILTTTDRPLVETVRATLEASGIAVVVEGDAVTALPFVPVKVLVSNSDVAHAQELVGDLIRPAVVRYGAARWHWARLVLAAILILVLMVCGNLLIG